MWFWGIIGCASVHAATVGKTAATAREELLLQEWVRSESKANVFVSEHTAAQQTWCWDGCLDIRSGKCSNKTKQRVCSPFFHQDMLNRLCATPGTQAYWINKHYRSKEHCCVSPRSVFAWANRQWKYFACPLCSVWFVQKGIHVFPLKMICEVISSSGKRACYGVTNTIISFQSLQNRFFFFFFKHYFKKAVLGVWLLQFLSTLDESVFITSTTIFSLH